MSKLKRILIMAGGTGGHVFPGLSVAYQLRKLGVDVHWLGTLQGIEAKLVPEASFSFHTINISGVRGKKWKTLIAAPLKILSAIKASHHLMKKINPDVVLGMGGFASGPGGMSAWFYRKPLVIHEQNAKAGMTNKCLAPFAKKILVGLPGSFIPNNKKIVLIGNPVRDELKNLAPPKERFKEGNQKLRLLVVGGSLGALAFNELLPKALSLLDKNLVFEIWHQTGKAHFEKTLKAYDSLSLSNERIKIMPFIEDMANAYAWANMVLSRSGALTVSELCAVGLGAIFVPYPYASDDHQTANAKLMVNQHAALCVKQNELTPERLASLLQKLALSSEKRLEMAEAAYLLRSHQVTDKIIEVLETVC